MCNSAVDNDVTDYAYYSEIDHNHSPGNLNLLALNVKVSRISMALMGT